MKTISKSLSRYLKEKYSRNVYNNYLFKSIYKLKILKNYLQSLKAMRSIRCSVDKCQVDVLVIHRIELNNRVGQKNVLLNKLRLEGLDVIEIETPKIRNYRSFPIHNSHSKESLLFWYHDLCSKYIVEKYSPKVILTDDNGSLFSPFLKEHAEKNSSKVVHLAHSVLTSESSKYDMIDYSYYFLYGKSSLRYLLKLKGKYGKCKVILSGGYIYSDNRFISPPRKDLAILVLGMGPAMEEDPVFFKYYKIISDWVASNQSQQVYIRLHPRSRCTYWNDLAKKYRNISVRPRAEIFNDVIQEVSLCITTYTNAVVDASLAGRPSILVADDDVDDYLELESYYLPRAKCKDDLSHRVDKMMSSLERYNKKAHDFSKYHVEKGLSSCDFIVEGIVKIVNGEELEIFQELNGDY